MRTRLLVISDTAVTQINGRWTGYEPVVKELEYLAPHWKEIVWIGMHKHPSETVYASSLPENIKVIPISAVGGKGWLDKIHVFLLYPLMLLKIMRHLPLASEVHVRAPSHPALLAILLAPLYRSKKFWVKYAGSWVDKASRMYQIQRELLKRLAANNIWVTINGNWTGLKSQLLPFENPCFDLQTVNEIEAGSLSKDFSGDLNLIYVGALSEFKGVHWVLEALTRLHFERIAVFHIVGTGAFEKKLKELAKESEYSNKILFHGALTKNEVFKLLAQCHGIVLASKSEGFPKVISEGMLFGCVPIASDVSCISQYVTAELGFIISEPDTNNVLIQLKRFISDPDLNLKSSLAQKQSPLFTYEKYVHRVLEEIYT